MPTIIAVDVSLSMVYRVIGFESNEKHTRLQLAAHAINTLLDYLALHSKLEYVAIVSDQTTIITAIVIVLFLNTFLCLQVTYSSKADVLSSFTRDYESLKSKIASLPVKDKTDYESLVKCLNRIVINDWGSYTPCQVRLACRLQRSRLLEINFPFFAGYRTH